MPGVAGHGTTISLGGVNLWEISVKPPAIQGGDPIDVSTMRNTKYRTKVPRQLKTLGEASFTASYSTDIFDNNWLLDQVGTVQAVSISFPDGSTLSFSAYIKSVEFSDHTEGEMPTVTITLQPV